MNRSLSLLSLGASGACMAMVILVTPLACIPAMLFFVSYLIASGGREKP